MVRGKWILVGGVAVFLAVAAGALSLLRERQKADAKKRQPAAAPAVFQGAEVTLSGKLRARNVVQVAAPLAGTVDSLLVEPGEEVYEGQLLGRIKNSGLEADEQAAAAELERAQARATALDAALIAARLEASRAQADSSRAQGEFERTEKIFSRQQMLLREGATPKLVFERAQAEYDSAQSERQNLAKLANIAEERSAALQKDADAARRALNEKNQELEDAKERATAAEIHSPVNGLLVARARQAGEEVTAEVKDLFQIATDLSQMEAVLTPTPPVLARMRPGQEAFLQTVEVADPIQGRVREVKGAEVIVEFVSPSSELKPGLSAQVRVKLT